MTLILVDMDATIADFENGFLRKWRDLYPDDYYIPIEDRTTYKIEDQYPEKFLEKVSSIMKLPGFFYAMDPIPGSIEALQEMILMGYEVFICTSPIKENRDCVLEKYDWVHNNLGEGWLNRLIITKDKTILRGDYLIDDRPDIDGVCQSVWEHILFDQPYNRANKSKRRLNWSNWKEVIDSI
jgi:5'-nucleotidase